MSSINKRSTRVVATFKKVMCLRFLVKFMVFQCMIIKLICLQSIFLQLFNEQSSKILPMMHIFEGMFFDLKLTLDLSEIWGGVLHRSSNSLQT